MGWRIVRAEARGLRSILSEMGNLKGLYKAVQESDLRVYRSLWLLGARPEAGPPGGACTARDGGFARWEGAAGF